MAAKLSDGMARSEPPPADGKPYRIIYDGEVKGFGLRITRSGSRSFVLNYRIRSVERRYTIGSYPDWSVSAGRAEAARLKREIDQGRDPMGERHEERAAPTVGELLDRYIEEHASRKREGSRREDEGLIRQWIRPELGRRKVADVRLADVEALHRKITRRGTPYRANRVVALLSKLFELAARWEMRPDNPTRGIERNPEHKRSRYLKPDELRRLTTVLAAHPNRAGANAIRLLLLTGARRGEVLGLRWDQLDFDAGTWTKPSSLTKQNAEHRIPLSAPALQVLSEIRSTQAKASPFAFPGRRDGAPLVNMRRIWEDVCNLAELPGVRIHDLRHSYASLLASSGLSLPIIGALLGHTQASTTQRYAHLLDDPLRAATERVGAVVTGAGDQSAAVIDIRRRQ
jgi:integrase